MCLRSGHNLQSLISGSGLLLMYKSMQAKEVKDCSNTLYKARRRRHRIEIYIEQLGKDEAVALCEFDKAQEQCNNCKEELLQLEQDYTRSCNPYISPISGTWLAPPHPQ